MTQSPLPGNTGPEVAPTGSIVVTGTLPDGHTWEGLHQPSPQTVCNRSWSPPRIRCWGPEPLGTEESLGKDSTRSRPHTCPPMDCLFSPAESETEQVTVTAPVGWSENFDSYSRSDRTSTARAAGRTSSVFRPTPLQCQQHFLSKRRATRSKLTPQTQQGDIRIVGHPYPQATSGSLGGQLLVVRPVCDRTRTLPDRRCAVRSRVVLQS